MTQLHCVVITPEKTTVDELADFVALPLFDGEIGIAPGRGPLIGRLGLGELRLSIGGKTQRYYIDGGFVEVHENVVSVLTDEALSAEELDPSVEEEELAAAGRAAANTAELMERRDRVVTRARARLRVARRSYRHGF
jgi:F-type H+-transporting ATPase subunit epsilon